MTRFQPEIGQLCFGGNAKVGAYALPAIAEAGVHYLARQIERVYWNVNQREWDRFEDPGIPGIFFRPYVWDDESDDAEKPNLAIEGFPLVQIRWYKHLGRSMNCTVKLSVNEWSMWLETGLKFVYEHDKRQG